MQLVSDMASTLIGSEVLKIAGEIQKLKAEGKSIVNFTVGDFDPHYFPIPEALKGLILDSLKDNQTNYPPSSGIAPLRDAVAQFYSTRLGIPTSPNEVLIAGGARPLIYTIFQVLVNRGDTVVYPVPSWNNNHYCHLSGAKGIAVETKPENGFLPTAEELAPHLRTARLLCLNSPLNPCGTAFREKPLKEICELVVEENKRRAGKERPLFLMYDQIYWMLTFHGLQHLNPVSLVPDIRPYTVFVDGISKYLCGTGLRVGWSVLPENLMSPFSATLGHIGAWAPKPEQIATAAFLKRADDLDTFVSQTLTNLDRRMKPLYEGVQKMKAKGLPIDAIEPEGGIYLSLQIRQPGKTNEQIRAEILQKAGVAIIPFQAFGLQKDSGWFRMSMGAVAEKEIPLALQKLEAALS